MLMRLIIPHKEAQSRIKTRFTSKFEWNSKEKCVSSSNIKKWIDTTSIKYTCDSFNKAFKILRERVIEKETQINPKH